MMNRRTAVRHVTLLAGAAALLPGCHAPSAADEPADFPLKHVPLTVGQVQLLAQVCDTLLPRTSTPGAHDLGLHLYVLKMLDDCTPQPAQQAFVAGLKQLDGASRRQQGQSFGASTPSQRLALLQSIDQQPKSYAADLVSFYRTARQLTIDGYTNSQYFMTKQVLYELVPGRYDGYFPVSEVNLAVPHHGQS